MINYDIHWNPVRLMQRIGRVDRRMNPEVEARLDGRPPRARRRPRHGHLLELPAARRAERAPHALHARSRQKTLLISKTLGIEGKKLLTPEDDYEALKEFNHAYEGTTTAVEEMHLEYQALLDETPGLAERARAACPARSSAVASAPTKGLRGVFFCYRAAGARHASSASSPRRPARPAGTSTTLDTDAILEEPGRDRRRIRSTPETPRVCTTDEPTLLDDARQRRRSTSRTPT